MIEAIVDTQSLKFVYTLGDEKVTLQEAAMLYYMSERERELDCELVFSIEDFVEHFANSSSRSSWLLSADMMILSAIVKKSCDGSLTLTDHGESWIHDNFSSLYALSVIYTGDHAFTLGEC